MLLDEMVERLTSDRETRDKWIGIYIGIVAVLLAICSTGGGNAAKDAMRANIEASNTWAFFQAKNIRRNSINLAADELELTLAAQPGMPEAARRAVEDKIKGYRATAQQLTTDPVRKEGLDELFVKAKDVEKERDIALRKDPYFDWSQAFLQIAIVLATVCLVTGTAWLLAMSATLAVLGVLLMVNGFTLAVAMPILG